MNLTSTLLKVDLAVLSVLLGVVVVGLTWLHKIQEQAAKAATERAETRGTIEFYGKRLDDLENWRSAISEIRRGR